LIKKDNPEMTDDLLKFGHDKLKEYGIVDSGEAKAHGIGAMTEARWGEFFKQMSAQGVYPADMDWKKAYTLKFVSK
jgi:NitT/TauT family transport system substrate-binding protein